MKLSDGNKNEVYSIKLLEWCDENLISFGTVSLIKYF